MTARPHDALFKEVFSDLANARGELVSVLPKEISALVDWSTLRLEPGSFVDEALRETLTDLLFSVRMRASLAEGREVRLHLLFEHQSSVDPVMPLRALSYIVRTWQAMLLAEPKRVRLPPVIPVLLAQVDAGWHAPRDLSEMIDFVGEAERDAIGRWLPTCRVLVDDLAGLSNEALGARPMPDAAKLALAALRDVRATDDIAAVVASWGAWIRGVMRQPEGTAALKTLVRYILYAKPAVDVQVVAAAVRRIDASSEETVMTTAKELMQQGEEIGLAKGIEKGMEKGRAELLLKLLRLKFPALSPEAVERVRAADAAAIDRWAEAVLTASTVDELLAR
ncbi:MAG: Rpn family recombination-promoting nuclease/putative transposase [Sandaracinus sp.]